MRISRMLGASGAVMALHLVSLCAAEFKPVSSMRMPCVSQRQSLSPKGGVVAFFCEDHSVLLVDASSGATLHSFPAVPAVLGSTFSRDDRWFAVLHPGGEVEVVPAAAASPATARKFKLQGNLRDIDFLPDGSGFLATVDNGPGQVWDTRGTPKQIATLHNDFGRLTANCFSPDGRLLVTADGDTVIRFYDTANWRPLHEYRGRLLETFTVEFTPDGKHVLLGGADDTIALLDTAGSEERRTEKDPFVPFVIVPFGSSGQALVHYFDADGKAADYQAIWSRENGKSTPLKLDGAVTSARAINGQLWLVTTKGNQLQIAEYH